MNRETRLILKALNQEPPVDCFILSSSIENAQRNTEWLDHIQSVKTYVQGYTTEIKTMMRSGKLLQDEMERLQKKQDVALEKLSE